MSAERPPITTNDLFGVLHEALAHHDQDFQVWIDREGFETEAIGVLAEWAADVLEANTLRGSRALGLFFFCAGWDAHHSLRGERSEAA